MSQIKFYVPKNKGVVAICKGFFKKFLKDKDTKSLTLCFNIPIIQFKLENKCFRYHCQDLEGSFFHQYLIYMRILIKSLTFNRISALLFHEHL